MCSRFNRSLKCTKKIRDYGRIRNRRFFEGRFPLFIIYPLTTISLIAVIYLFLIRKILSIHKEILIFSKADRHRNLTEDPLYGLNVNGILPMPEYFRSKSKVIIIVDPTCNSCLTEIDEFINDNHNQTIPFICYVTNENNNAYNLFIEKYRNLTTLVTININLLIKLNIVYSPVILVVDSTGIIIRVESLMRKILEYYNKHFRN